MAKKAKKKEEYKPRWMTECDVIRYNLRIPEDMKETIRDEADKKGLDMSSYICGVISGEIKPPGIKKTPARKKK